MIHASQSAAIFGMQGLRLTAEEKDFFAQANPYGFILFARNCESPAQIRALIAELKALAGRDNLPVLIDQEGGRVARLRPPYWPAYPAAGVFAELALSDMEAAQRATYYNARLIADDLQSLGITVDCAPLADLPVDGAHDIIGDRAFGRTPAQVTALARAMAKGLSDGGVVPVLKHIPGHGRACADSHEELPVVDTPLETLRTSDFMPFKALADLPMAMTAHVLYTAIDPECMVTLSKTAIDLIRHELGFDGLLMSDDMSMKAMGGDFTTRARAALAAGCDVVLHCNGDMQEMQAIMRGVQALTGESLRRAAQAMHGAGRSLPFDRAEAQAMLARILPVYA